MTQRLPISAFGPLVVRNLCVLSGGDPPLDLHDDLHFQAPAPTPAQTMQMRPIDPTWWGPK